MPILKKKTESESAQVPFPTPNFLNSKLSEKIWMLKIF